MTVIGRIGCGDAGGDPGDIHNVIGAACRWLAALTRALEAVEKVSMSESPRTLSRGSPTESAPIPRAGSISVEVVTDSWYQCSCTLHNNSEYHARRSRTDVRRIAAALGWNTIADIDDVQLTDWLVQYVQSGRAPQTAGKLLSQWVTFGEFLVQRKHWTENKLAKIPVPRVKAENRGPGARAFSIDEVRRLIERAQTMEAEHRGAGRYGANRSTLYLFLAHTGLRYSEAIRMRWETIDLERGYIRVKADKAGRGDGIPIHDELREALIELRSAGKFPSTDSKSRKGNVFWATSKNTLLQDMDKVGVPRRVAEQGGQWHCFRKMGVTERLRAGADPEHVRRLARHKNLELTMGTYNQMAAEELRAAVDAIPHLLGKNSGFDRLQTGESSDSLSPASHHDESSPKPDDAPRPVPCGGDSLSKPSGRRASSVSGPQPVAPHLKSPQDQWSRGESNPGPRSVS